MFFLASSSFHSYLYLKNQSHLSSVNHPQELKAIQVNTVVILPIKAVAFPVSLLLHF